MSAIHLLIYDYNIVWLCEKERKRERERERRVFVLLYCALISMCHCHVKDILIACLKSLLLYWFGKFFLTWQWCNFIIKILVFKHPRKAPYFVRHAINSHVSRITYLRRKEKTVCNCSIEFQSIHIPTAIRTSTTVR